MPRWEPDARPRLVNAALELFAQQGYEATTVNEIADLAGLTKTTFFRHFSDKREVLFAGQEIHAQIVAEAVAAAPASATPLEAAGLAVDALTARFTPARREFNVRFQLVISGNPELQERAAYKREALVGALKDALGHHDFPEETAGLAAELGIRAFYRAHNRWIEPGNRASLTALARDELGRLRAAVASLS